jgi:hypothetical protein
MTFRLKYLFCLVLVVGVSLMWWMWCNRLSANRLLKAREIAKTESGKTQTRSLLATLNIQGHFGAADLDPYGMSHACSATWSGCPSRLVAVIDRPGGTSVKSVIWPGADWPYIEAKARVENWTFHRQLIVTVLVGLFVGWVVWPKQANRRLWGNVKKPVL